MGADETLNFHLISSFCDIFHVVSVNPHNCHRRCHYPRWMTSEQSLWLAYPNQSLNHILYIISKASSRKLPCFSFYVNCFCLFLFIYSLI